MPEKDIWERSEASHPGGLKLTEELIKEAEKAGLMKKGETVLDICCGNGESTRLLIKAGYSSVGVDKSRKLLPEEPNFYLGEAENLPVADSSFDACLAECCLSIVDTEKVIKEIGRVLRPGGVLLVSDLVGLESGGVPGKNEWQALFEDQNIERIYYKDDKKEFQEYVIRWRWKYRTNHPRCCKGSKKISYFGGLLRLQKK